MRRAALGGRGSGLDMLGMSSSLLAVCRFVGVALVIGGSPWGDTVDSLRPCDEARGRKVTETGLVAVIVVRTRVHAVVGYAGVSDAAVVAGVAPTNGSCTAAAGVIAPRCKTSVDLWSCAGVRGLETSVGHGALRRVVAPRRWMPAPVLQHGD